MSASSGYMENGRIVNPFNSLERPTFLPGDKVRDKRDVSRKTWRIVARVAHADTEMMTLREVGDDSNERHVLARDLVPHLEMVAMSTTVPPPIPPATVPADDTAERIVHEPTWDEVLGRLALATNAATIRELQGFLASRERTIAELQEQLVSVTETLNHTREWYGARMKRLGDMARAEFTPELRGRFFSIIANATVDAFEPPTYELQFNLLKHERDQLQEQLREAQKTDWRKCAEKLVTPLEAIVTEVDSNAPETWEESPWKEMRQEADEAIGLWNETALAGCSIAQQADEQLRSTVPRAELEECLAEAESGLASERLAANIVKEEFYKGQVSAFRIAIALLTKHGGAK